jgi:hypothetical protein
LTSWPRIQRQSSLRRVAPSTTANPLIRGAVPSGAAPLFFSTTLSGSWHHRSGRTRGSAAAHQWLPNGALHMAAGQEWNEWSPGGQRERSRRQILVWCRCPDGAPALRAERVWRRGCSLEPSSGAASTAGQAAPPPAILPPERSAPPRRRLGCFPGHRKRATPMKRAHSSSKCPSSAQGAQWRLASSNFARAGAALAIRGRLLLGHRTPTPPVVVRALA